MVLTLRQMAEGYLKNLELKHKQLMADIKALEAHMEECKVVLDSGVPDGASD